MFNPSLVDVTKSTGPSASAIQKAQERCNIRQNQVGLRNRWIKRYVATVDPGDGQPERLRADHVGELRLPRMQDFISRDTGIRDQIAEERAVGFVTLGALGGADNVKVVLQRGQGEKVVVDIGYDGNRPAPRHSLQCPRHVGEQCKLGE